MISVGFSSHAAETPGNHAQVTDYLAILDLEIVGNIDQGIGRPLSDCIRREVVGFGKFRVMERRRMDKILQEQAFRMTGCVERQCARARQCFGAVPGLVWDLSLVLGIRSHRPSRWRALPSDSGRVVQGFTSGTSQLKPRQVEFPYPCGGENRLSPRIVRPIKTSPGVSHNDERMRRGTMPPCLIYSL